MPEPVAYLNGEFLPVSKCHLHAFDLGVVGGIAVCEMIRTFSHAPFRLKEHLKRLSYSLAAVGLEVGLNEDELAAIGEKIVQKNAKLAGKSQELGLIYFATPGLNPTYVGLQDERRCTVGVHTFPLHYEMYAAKYHTGQHLLTTSIRALPPDVIDPHIKFRSRLHWYLADQEARSKDPAAQGLLLDHDGFVTETSAGNLVAVVGNELLSPGLNSVLPGISLSVVRDLAASLRLSFRHCRLSPALVMRADECFLTTTPTCIMPVTQLNGQAIGRGVPGPVTLRLLSAWSDLVGVKIVEQMQGKSGASTEKKPKSGRSLDSSL